MERKHFFVDDNFIGNRNMLKQEILPALIEWMKENRTRLLFTEASINLSDDDELVDMMAEAGFNTVFVGIESPNDESLAECNKYQNKGRNLLDCIKKLQRSGLEVQGGFILGFDNDPDSIFETLIKFIQESGVITAMVGLLNAPRGTKLHQRLEKEGRLINGMSGNNTDFSINFIPKMNQKSLIEGYKKVLGTIYAPRQYYERIMRFFKEFNPLKERRIADINLCSFAALFKSMFRLGIMESERVYYWRLFFWSLFKRPRFFPKAIAYAIYGYHFRKVFETQVQFE